MRAVVALAVLAMVGGCRGNATGEPTGGTGGRSAGSGGASSGGGENGGDRACVGFDGELGGAAPGGAPAGGATPVAGGVGPADAGGAGGADVGSSATTGYLYHVSTSNVYATIEGQPSELVLDISHSSVPLLIASPSGARVAYAERAEQVIVVEGATGAELARWPEHELIGWLDEDTLLVQQTTDDIQETFTKDLDGTEGERFENPCDAQQAGLAPDRSRLAVACPSGYGSELGILDLTTGELLRYEETDIDFNQKPVWTENGFIVWSGAWDDTGVVHMRGEDVTTLSGVAGNAAELMPWGRNSVLASIAKPDVTPLEYSWYRIDIPCGEPVELTWLSEQDLDPWEFQLSRDESRVLLDYAYNLYTADVDGSNLVLVSESGFGVTTVAW